MAGIRPGVWATSEQSMPWPRQAGRVSGTRTHTLAGAQQSAGLRWEQQHWWQPSRIMAAGIGGIRPAELPRRVNGSSPRNSQHRGTAVDQAERFAGHFVSQSLSCRRAYACRATLAAGWVPPALAVPWPATMTAARYTPLRHAHSRFPRSDPLFASQTLDPSAEPRSESLLRSVTAAPSPARR